MNSEYEDSSALSPVESGDEEEAEEVSEAETEQLGSSSDSDEDESEEKIDETAAAGDENGGKIDEAAWTSKNGKISWFPTNVETFRYIPAATGLTPGPTRYATLRIVDPISSFALFLTDEIVKHIVSMTNLHGNRKIPGWRDIDAEEFRAYVGLLVLSGVYRSKHESTKSLWSEKWGRSIFRATMSEKRFQNISRALRFDDKLSRPPRRLDKMAPFRKVWNMWTHRLEMLFSPDRDLCVDEQLVAFRGRCSFRQYMPKKPAKYGIKIWAACDVKTSYAWRLQVYTGKAAPDRVEVNQGMRVVLDMTEGLQGHVVTCDNFFTSCALADELLKRKMALVGTIRQNKPELPPHLLQAKKREIFSSIFAFTNTHTLVSYIPRRGKNVLLLSTKHRRPDVSKEGKRKPVIIEDYNKCKGGVDNLDKVVGTYSCRRRTNYWPLALFHNVLDVSLYNAYVLWTSIESSWQKQKGCRRRLFIEEVGEMLVNPHIAKRERLPRSSAAAAVVTDMTAAAAWTAPITQCKSRRQCELCKEKRRRVVNTCCKCEKYTCKDHSVSICNDCAA
ncbi:piggyBac transposable element-derived protein 4-like [Simochromis diagramma]|uniref:piggyBac transposable element-derived protein 4-like n=1 Tax=Simochromis diagramma TaxID=43689 RepID=UPI001A7E6AB5|nr:piggyBac transposable element-derived protein 4-like [Simochromis diagramma]